MQSFYMHHIRKQWKRIRIVAYSRYVIIFKSKKQIKFLEINLLIKIFENNRNYRNNRN